MSDIDIFSINENGFEMTTGESESLVSGNRALLNRFQITFFYEDMNIVSDTGETIYDEYGGRAFSMIGSPRALRNTSSITASITAAMNNTAESIKLNTDETALNTERLDRVELDSVLAVGDTVTAVINVYPVELETLDVPSFNIPITSR